MKIPKCPKCKNEPIYLQELWENHGIEFTIKGDGSIDKDGIVEMGDPYCVMAVCSCGHKWRVKKIVQITDFDEWEEE